MAKRFTKTEAANRLARSYAKAPVGVRVVIVPGSKPPELLGGRPYYTTPAGKLVQYPSTYRLRFGRPIYHPSTIRVEVGERFMRLLEDHSGMALVCETY